MKKVVQIVLAVVIVGLGYFFYNMIMTPVNFQKEVKAREAEVIKRIVDIRSAEQAYKQVYLQYCNNFEELINFVLYDSLTFERSLGSKDDSVAVAQGLVKTELFKVPVIDTIFKTKLTPDQVRQFPIIPFGNGAKYILRSGFFETESGVTVPVFECAAPYKDFLSDLDQQELINLIDEKKAMNKYPGIKVGALDQATNDAGNWE